MRVHPLISLTVCGVAAILSAAAWPAAASAEAVASTRPALPAGVLTLPDAAGTPRKESPGVFVYAPGATPPASTIGPYAVPQGGRFVTARATSAAGTASAAWQPGPPARWEWAAQGGAAVLLYGLSRKGRRRRALKRVRW